MIDAPCLFDSKGIFAPLSDEQIATLSEPLRRAYDAVAAAAAACERQEQAVTDTTARLHAVVRDLREAEQALQKSPKPSFMDVWRRDLVGSDGRG